MFGDPLLATSTHVLTIIQWLNNGIVHVVGDNTRPVLMNTVRRQTSSSPRMQFSNQPQENEFWPLISTVASNGYAGLTIVPRWGKLVQF